jgi:hypothetical protein
MKVYIETDPKKTEPSSVYLWDSIDAAAQNMLGSKKGTEKNKEKDTSPES